MLDVLLSFEMLLKEAPAGLVLPKITVSLGTLKTLV